MLRGSSAGVERQRAGEDPTGKIPIYKSLRSARKEPRTPTSKKADRETPFVPGISALRELLDKTMSNHVKNAKAFLYGNPTRNQDHPQNKHNEDNRNTIGLSPGELQGGK